MEELADVAIISAYGRGNWLAQELAARGWKVSLIDTSEELGAWKPEDYEGPFGLFDTQDILPSQRTRFSEDEESHVAETGFVLWLKEGPIEFRSPLSQFSFQKRKIAPQVLEYLHHETSVSQRQKKKECRDLNELEFEQTWLARIAHQAVTNVYRENHQALEGGEPAALLAPLQIRQATPAGLARGFKICQKQGVRVIRSASVTDVRFHNRELEALEVVAERSGVERAKSFVWMLTSEESQRFSQLVKEKMFPHGFISPAWTWLRLRIEMDTNSVTEMLPRLSLLVKDLHLPWTHANFIYLKRTAEEDSVDAWVRSPTWARFDKKYLETLRDQVLQEVRERLPLTDPEITQMPAEYEANYGVVGASRFPIYAEGQLAKLRPVQMKNLFYDGPEYWPSLDWHGMFQTNLQTLISLEKLKVIWEAAEAKRVAKENAQKQSSERSKGGNE